MIASPGPAGFGWFAASLAVALLADHLFLVTLSWVGAETSALALGSILAVAAATRAITTVLGGLASDRWGPVRVLLGGFLLRGAGLLAVGSWPGLAAMPGTLELYALAATIGALEGLVVSPMLAAVPRLVPPHASSRGNGITQGLIQISALLGPLLGGVLLTSAGPRAALGISGGACLVAAVGLGRVRVSALPPVSSATGSAGPSVLAYLRGEPVVRIALVMLACVYLGLLGPVQVGIPAEVQARLGHDPRWLGVLLGAFGGGLLLGTATAGLRAPPRWIGRHLVGSLLVIATGLAVVGLLPGPGGKALGLLLAGAGMGNLNVRGLSWLHRHVPAALMGRVMGLVMLSANAAIPLSLWACGWLTLALGPGVFGVGAAVVLLGTARAGLDRRFRLLQDPA